MDIKRFEQLPLLGILRGITEADVEPLVETVAGAGLGTIEITMNTPGAAVIIKKAVKAAGNKLVIGAGTVLSKDDFLAAVDAGASFIVMPACVEDVMDLCRKQKIPAFPGALTPTEVFNAWNAGATMVKVFPAGLFGPKYIKELKGPYDRIKLMAVGGVDMSNISEFFSCGADAVAFGASVFKKEWLEKKDFVSIGKLVKEYVNRVKKVVSL